MNSNFVFPGCNTVDQAPTNDANASQGVENRGDQQGAPVSALGQGSLLQDYLQQQQQQQQQLLQVPQQNSQQFAGGASMDNLTAISGMQGLSQKVGLNFNVNPASASLTGFDTGGQDRALDNNWGNAAAASNMAGNPQQVSSNTGFSMPTDQMLLARRAQATGGDMNAAALMGSTMGGGSFPGSTSFGGDFSAQQRLLALQTLQSQVNEGGTNATLPFAGGFNASIGNTGNIGVQSAAANQMLLAQQLNMQGPTNDSALMMGGGGVTGLAPSQTDAFAAQGLVGPWSERAAGLMGSMVCSNPSAATTKAKRPRRKQPKDKPKRPLSAYNIFFREERARLMQKGSIKRTANGKIGFESLAKIIGGKWQDLPAKDAKKYKEKAAEDMKRYREEMEVYKKKQKAKTSDGKGDEGDDSDGNKASDSDRDDGEEADDGEEKPSSKKQKHSEGEK